MFNKTKHTARIITGRAAIAITLFLLNVLYIAPAYAKDMPCCLAENLERYEAYAEKNPSKDYADVLIEVNLHLDDPNYENVVVADEPHSLTVLVTKHYALPRKYKPDDLVSVKSKYAQKGVTLRSECYDALLLMAKDMEDCGLTLYLKSGYRTNRKRGGADDLWYAWPGHSEHQTGYAFDLRKKNVTYDTLGEYRYHETDEYEWLCNNAYRYGFILSFPYGLTEITGFGFEPWHWRYIGVDIATEMKELGIRTFHQYWARYLAG